MGGRADEQRTLPLHLRAAWASVGVGLDGAACASPLPRPYFGGLQRAREPDAIAAPPQLFPGMCWIHPAAPPRFISLVQSPSTPRCGDVRFIVAGDPGRCAKR